ncbi:hypothetical protein [Psychroserpens algicola]|uniref:Rho termination factor N-terminal domain-containing protein n=1 Tax=Psychroserpens algicola TaxID=1719034 RepID=A0ABT0HD22_9FLAO|nr:hypothetical protein [Psychroserpens algicola]MCK8481717.1 hypothetical protein [Psychroserpens algicola]
MKNNYYIQISSTSLSHYFVRGCIIPSKYIENKIYDFQDRANEGLIISYKKWNKSNDCSIEIIVTEEEVNQFTKLNSDNFFYNGVFPISRIQNIYFNTKEQAETTVWNINNGAGFIPNKLIKIEEKQEPFSQTIDNVKNLPSKDLSKKIKAFDLLMGGFAFMRIGTDNPNNVLLNYPENYISTLSYFNNLIKKELLSENETISKKYFTLFNDEKSEISYFKKFLGKNIGFDILESIAKENNIKLDKKFGRINIDNIPNNSPLYNLSILASYGTNSEKSIDNLVSDFISGKIDKKKVEEIFLIFGLNTGYSSLRNSYSSQNLTKTVKFELNSKLDYYTIESLYYYAINHQISDDFPYLENIIHEEKEDKKIPLDYRYYRIFNTKIVTKKKDYSEYLEKFSKTLALEISNWFPQNFISSNSKNIENHIQNLLKPNFDLLIKELQEKSNIKFKQEKSEDIIKLSNYENKKNISLKEDNDKIIVIDKLMKLKKDELQNIAKEKGIDYKKSDTKKILCDVIYSHNSNATLFS